MHEIPDIPDLNIASVRLSGTLTQDDYDAVAPYVKDKAERHTTTRFCFVLDDVDAWGEDSDWPSWSLDVRHTRDVDKIAVISDAPWETWMKRLDLIFPAADVQTFETKAEDDAWSWLRGTPHAEDGAAPEEE
jgi:hypothetical protein